MMTSLVLAAALVSGGKPVSHVNTECDAKEELQIAFAAQELTNWVGRITGAAIPVDGAAKASLEIYLGTPGTSKTIAAFAAKHAKDFEKIGKTDGFVIAEEGGLLGFGGKRLYIAGNKTKGVLNGVYRFLDRNTDLIFARGLEGDNGFGTVYSKTPDLKNAIDHVVEVPSLARFRYFRGSDLWQVRNLCSQMYRFDRTFDLKRFKAFGRLWDNTDGSLGLDLGLVDKYKDSNPDVFPLVDGKRDFSHDHQLCFMNPKTAELFAKETCAVLEGMPASLTKVWAGIGDNWSLCTCAEHCQKPIELKDGKKVLPTDANFRSTQYALFVNRVSDLVRPRFPRVQPMPTGMYLFLTECPAVSVAGGSGCYCPYVKNHKKPVYDDGANEVWHAKAEAFYKNGISFDGLYEYYLCTTTPRFYHAIAEVAQQDLRYYLKHGLSEYYLDTNGYDEKCYPDSDVWGFDVSAIEFWTMTRLMWNADIDVTETRHEFCRRAYREAAPVLIEFFDTLAKNYNADPAGCFWNDDPVNACKHYIVEKNLAGWARAKLAAAQAAVRHPSAKELVKRLCDRLLPLIDKSEKAPKRVELTVPQILEKPTHDLSSAYWRKASRPRPLTAAASTNAPFGKMDFALAHDRRNLYILVEDGQKEDLEKFRKIVKEGRYQKPWPAGEPFVWETPVEIYLDGDRGPKGSYYMFSYMFTGRRFTGHGSSEAAGDPVKWTVDLWEADGRLYTIATFPLADLGIDISKGNKVGCMFVGGGHTAWNGGQWHAPTSFQTIVLEMK